MQGEISVLNDALDAQRQTNDELSNKVKILEDNNAIKVTAVRYAKISLIVIPVSCLVLFLLSSLNGTFIELASKKFILGIKISPYAQAALIIAPIAFFATIIGFLLRGVFGQKIDVNSLSAQEALRNIQQ